MKKITLLIFIAAAWFTISGCSKDSPSPDHSLGPVMNNYVRGYIRPVKLFLPDDVSNYQTQGFIHTQIVLMTPIHSIKSYNNGERWTYEMIDMFNYKNIIRPTSLFEYNDDKFPVIPELVNRYDSLCKAHKDTEYSKKEKHYSGEQFPYATYRRMTLDVTSDEPYDATHPSGTSLADIIDIYAYSAKEMIDSGYDYWSVCEKGEIYDNAINFGKKLDMSLTQFNEEYRKLIADNIKLRFKTAPDVTSTHRFTVTYRDEDGRVLTATAAPVTLQGKGAE